MGTVFFSFDRQHFYSAADRDRHEEEATKLYNLFKDYITFFDFDDKKLPIFNSVEEFAQNEYNIYCIRFESIASIKQFLEFVKFTELDFKFENSSKIKPDTYYRYNGSKESYEEVISFDLIEDTKAIIRELLEWDMARQAIELADNEETKEYDFDAETAIKILKEFSKKN